MVIMNAHIDLQRKVLLAAQEQGIGSVLFRSTLGRKLGLSITESECLSYLAIKGVATPTELARYTGLTTGSTTTMLDRLEKADFISRKPNPTDRRGVLIEPTQKWRTIAQPLVAGVVKAHAELISSYSDTELATIADFLTRFTANVTEHTKAIEKL